MLATKVAPREESEPGLPPPENKKFYPALDGLRALAVLAVFCQHYIPTALAYQWGWMGVDLFFVLSGFLITGILYDTRNAAHRVRNFYVRRTLRIFPLYYAVLLAALLLEPMFHWVWHPAWILNLLYLGNYSRFIWIHDFMRGTQSIEHLQATGPIGHHFFLHYGHFWSLAVEEQFYLIWPAVVFFVRDRMRLRNLCAVICVSCLAARIACVYFLPVAYLQAEILYRATPLRADALLLGALIALMLRGPEVETLKRSMYPLFFTIASCCALFELVYVIKRHRPFGADHTSVMDTVGFTVIDVIFALIILISLEPGTILYRFLTMKPLRRLGQMSYGFYVFHDIPHIAYQDAVHYLIANNRHMTAIVAVFAMGMTLILSYLSYKYFESPFLRLKDRFTVSQSVPSGKQRYSSRLG